ncbi:MAG: hypothetical protein BGO43_00675 [Gammaproteobacteria bacterium 39-13]|nr:DUF1254 domain-containing protein [Gammaproteobacteria bacterium]OJV96770.1 MAG: hypothetical protein BGO43_00675 [Gammaproteobacteria bacterium 39-13]
MKNHLLLASFLTLSISWGYGSAKQVDSPLTPKEAYKLAKEAYIFSFPLLMNYRTMHMQAIDENSKFYNGGFGKWRSYDPASPENQDVVTPNIDTPYSFAWVDLRQEPWVLTLPKIDTARYYTSQWNDLWGFVLDNPGSIKDGNEGGNFLLAGPNWKGKKPEGIKRIIQGESSFLGSLTRTEFLGNNDLDNLSQIQKNYKLQPLSAFLGKTAPKPAAKIEWLQWKEEDLHTDAVFTYVNFLLSLTKPNAADQAILHRIAKLGIIGGKPWQPEKLDPKVREYVQQGIIDATSLIEEGAKESKNSSSFFGNRETMQNEYLHRAVGVYAGMFSNTADQAFYIPWDTDAEGHYLDGSKYAYEITFPANGAPPVKYFWSITMYSLTDHFLVANPIHRYSINSRNPIVKEKDGAMTIFISHRSPGKDKELNWLPTPKGPFYMVLRTYGPSTSIVDEKWEMPVVKAVPAHSALMGSIYHMLNWFSSDH